MAAEGRADDKTDRREGSRAARVRLTPCIRDQIIVSSRASSRIE